MFVEDIEFKEVMWQVSIKDRMFSVKSLAVHKILLAEHLLKCCSFGSRPLFEQIVLRMHTGSDFVSTALKHESVVHEVDSDVGAV